MKTKMNEVIVDCSFLNVNCGLVKLTEKQAKDRIHNLKETEDKGIYEVVKQIQFKNGEVFSTDQVPAKKNKEPSKSKKTNAS